MEEAIKDGMKIATEFFPHTVDEVIGEQGDEHPSIFFGHLYLWVVEAHVQEEDKDIEFLKKAYGFTEWALGLQEADFDTWTAVHLSFYEGLFLPEQKVLWEKYVPWLSPRAFDATFGLAEGRSLPDDEKDLLESMYMENKNTLFKENILHSGEI